MESIGVRELRQHASRYLARAATGERILVTDRGRPVAMLGPPPAEEDNSLEALAAAGRIIPPSRPGGLLDIEPADYGFSASEMLAAMREHER